MRKVIFMALATVFMFSSGFTPEENVNSDVDFDKKCTIIHNVVDGEGNLLVRYTYTRIIGDDESCSDASAGLRNTSIKAARELFS